MAGKTRKEAHEKTQLTLELADEQSTIYNIGMTMVYMLPICTFCACCCSIFLTKGPITFGILCVCTRLCWLIMGPISLINLASMNDHADYNISVAEEFEIINECGQAAVNVNIGDMKHAIETQRVEVIY